MGNFELGMITKIYTLGCMKLEAGNMSPSILERKEKKQTKPPHWVYCCTVQNILSFLWMTHIHIVLQKPSFSQSKISKTPLQNIVLQKPFSQSNIPKAPLQNIFIFQNGTVRLWSSETNASTFIFAMFAHLFISQDNLYINLFDFWFTFANAVVVYTAVFFLQAVIRTRTVTSRYPCFTTTEISALPRSGWKSEEKDYDSVHRTLHELLCVGILQTGKKKKKSFC